MTSVVLLGDSTLDNVVWTSSPKHSVPVRLDALLKERDGNAKVVNLAADAFTSKDVLHGAVPFVSYEARKKAGDPFPGALGEVFQPLKVLRQLKDPKPSHVVLSVGGNDVREILRNLNGGNLFSTLQQLMANWTTMTSEIASQNIPLIFVFLYRPSTKQNNYHVYEAMSTIPVPGNEGVSKLEFLLQSFYTQAVGHILQVAPKNLAFADLTNSFNCRDESLYSHQIEPSDEGSTIVASLIDHIVAHHDFAGTPVVYRKDLASGEFVAAEPATWSVVPQ